MDYRARLAQTLGNALGFGSWGEAGGQVDYKRLLANPKFPLRRRPTNARWRLLARTMPVY